MTAEELAEVLKALNTNKPQVNQTINFNAPVGQQIAHVDKIEAHFDKNMGMQIAHAEEVSAPSDNALPLEDSLSDPLLSNNIFSPKIFNSNAKVVRLRDAVGASIKGAKLTNAGSALSDDRYQINPSAQNEWYYIWKMIAESGLLAPKTTVRAFIGQMLEWYPEVLETPADEEQKTAFVEKVEKSVSAEKRKWLLSGTEVPFTDMNHKWRELQLDSKKVRPILLVCRDLRDALKNLKSAIEQEDALNNAPLSSR